MKKNLSSYFFINNTKINNIEKNRNIIDYLENLNIKIPHYCYHPKLSISGNCRMCLVELKNSPKPLVSCAMTITNKMEIYTESPLVKKARENILEFLLLNHPLDCPICDQGGECDLQDQSMVFGSSKKRFYNYKRSITNKNLGPIVKTVMTRCIHCTKCVRFAEEIAGIPELGMFGRGYNSEIGTYVSKIFDSELSGNIIDICPVGALTSKPYSFVDRSWELSKIHSIDFTDSFGLDLSLSVKAQSTITKIQPSYNKQDLSNSWISNKTRFCFDGMFSPEKLSNLNVSTLNEKKNSWEKVFKEIINILFFHDHLNNYVFSTNKLNFLVGENLGVEVIGILFLLQKKYSFINVNKTEKCFVNMDLENNFITHSANNELSLNTSNICLLIGINTRFESPSLNIKLRQRVLQGNFKVYAINSHTDLNFPYENLGNNLTILKSLSEGNHLICQEFKNSKNPLIIYNSNLYKKPVINSYLSYIKNFSVTTFNKWEGTNFVSKTLSESNINFINNLPHLSKKTCLNSLGLYCLNISSKELFFKKLVYIKYLNYISASKPYANFILK
jgi:NADH-quinone oxidoreductase chain G